MIEKEKRLQHQQMSLLAYYYNTYQISTSKWSITQEYLLIAPKRNILKFSQDTLESKSAQLK
jgi:hypothetical protein